MLTRKLPLLFFNADDGAGDGGGSIEPQEQQSTPEKEEKTFSQKDVDSMLSDRLAKQEKSMLKKFGFEDAGKLGDALKQFKEMQESQMSDLEKAQARNAELETEIETLRGTATKAELKSEALALGVNPEKLETVLKLAPAYDGETSTDKIKALLEDVPGLKSEEKPQGPSFGGPAGGKTPDKNETMMNAAYKAAGLSL